MGVCVCGSLPGSDVCVTYSAVAPGFAWYCGQRCLEMRACVHAGFADQGCSGFLKSLDRCCLKPLAGQHDSRRAKDTNSSTTEGAERNQHLSVRYKVFCDFLDESVTTRGRPIIGLADYRRRY